MEQEAWRILIVEDDRRLAELTREYLEGNGLKVDIEANGALAAARILAERPDLVVLDLMLPGEDGLSICRQVRPQFDGPILMLTARTDDMDEVLGLEMGADDYVCKPVRPRVLLARIRALLRRSEAPEAGRPGGGQQTPGVRSPGDRQRDARGLAGRDHHRADQRRIRPALAAGGERRAHSLREEIFNALRGIEYDGQDRSIDVRISRIRPKIGDDPMHPRLIKTVRSKGYLFVGEG